MTQVLNLIAGMFLASWMTATQAETLVIARISNTPDHLIGVRLLSEVYKRAGIAVSFKKMQSKRALVESSSGRVDGELLRIHSLADDFPTLIRVPTPFTSFVAAVFTATKDFQVAGWESLEGQGKIGWVRGTRFAEIGLANISNTKVVIASDQLFKMLARGRLDYAVTVGVVGRYQARALGLPQVRQLEPPIERYELYHYLHEKHIALVPRIDAVINEMVGTGEMQRMQDEISDELLR